MYSNVLLPKVHHIKTGGCSCDINMKPTSTKHHGSIRLNFNEKLSIFIPCYNGIIYNMLFPKSRHKVYVTKSCRFKLHRLCKLSHFARIVGRKHHKCVNEKDIIFK